MYPSPDTTRTDLNPPVRKVYFNGFHGAYGSFNPNVATAQTSLYFALSYSFYAMLGVWKDCNRDGYVGYGDQGLFEYRVELLQDTSVCKPVATPATPPWNKPPLDWYPSNNDGQWVREFLPISWRTWNTAIQGDPNPYNIDDNASRVWADYGLPEATQYPALNCWFFPWPRGATQSTGGFLEYSDCYAGGRMTETINTFAPDTTPLGQLSFRDHPRDQHNSASTLNRPHPWGNERDAAYAQTWDCAYIVREDVRNPQSGAHVAYLNVTRPHVPSSVNPSGSPAGQVNTTYGGFNDCDRDGGGVAMAVYATEGDVIQPPFKRNPDVWMRPRSTARPVAPFGTILGRGTPDMPDAGTRLTSSDGLWEEPVGRNEFPFMDSRATFTTNWHNTFYAFISSSAITKFGLSLQKGNALSVYGSEACGYIGLGAGTRANGWDCDPTHWWLDVNGEDVTPESTTLSPEGTPYAAKVGAFYNMRDVDCYDQNVGALRNANVGASLVTGQRCA